MDSPVHIRLWHKDFWLLVIANMLLTTSITMLIPTLPHWLLCVEGLSSAETGVAMAAFAVGLFLPGAFCSYLVQRYRRNMVCVWSVIVLALTHLAPFYLPARSVEIISALRLLQGAAFGLAQMILTSTLIIDTCESFQRTEANHSSSWFGRFALSIGPMAGLLMVQRLHFEAVTWLAAACCLLSVVLVLMVRFPFRVPVNSLHVFSCDRFFLVSGWPLFLNLTLVTVALGLLLSCPLSEHFYGMLMIGFLLALLAQRFIFREAELKSEVVTGLLLIIAALLIVLRSVASPLCSPFLGMGIGIVGARFLLFFIKLSRHCQRGTAQSTFMLAWESGLALGLGLGYGSFDTGSDRPLVFTALALVAFALLLYVCSIHTWFVHHKNR